MSECDKYQVMMQRELDGELSEIEIKMLQKHIEQCPFCREEYTAFHAIADLFEEMEMVEPPLHLADLIMAEVMQIEADRESETEETAIVRNLKWIGLLVVLAGVNAAFFGSWLVSMANLKFDKIHLQLMARILEETFSHFELVGRATGDALQTVIRSVAGAVPWEWVGIYITLALLIFVGTWFVNRKGGDEA